VAVVLADLAVSGLKDIFRYLGEKWGKSKGEFFGLLWGFGFT
jgi:plasmid stabilization system protein ParE